MTEDEAKTKWCPHRAAMTGTLAMLAIQSGTLQSWQASEKASPTLPTCVGSACMMWRTEAMPVVNKDGMPVLVGQGLMKTVKFERGQHGYCGLAGRP